MKLYIRKSLLFFLSAGLLAACEMDFIDPGAASSEQIFANDNGLTAVGIGLQRNYTVGRAGSLYTHITANGFTTGELSLRNQGNTDEYNLSLGGAAIDGGNGVTGNLWVTSNKIIYDADQVIAGAARLGDKAYASGLIGYASIFKALSLGNMAQYWESIPDGIGEKVSFIPRQQGYLKAVQTLAAAQAAIQANAISSNFIGRIPAGIDIPNTVNALKARYALFAGNYDEALTAANAVSLTTKSEFRFDALTLNPIWETATSTNNVFQVIDSTFGLPAGLRPDMQDKRVLFYTSINAGLPRYRINGFGATSTTAFPVYLPGEMTLIKAECYARKNELASAITELNKILTKKPTADPFLVGADMPAYSGAETQEALLTEIYRQRSIELYMSGLRLEDTRRFGRPAAGQTGAERLRNFFPYPFRERDNNPNTPANPAL